MSKFNISLGGDTTMGDLREVIEYLKKMNIEFKVRFM